MSAAMVDSIKAARLDFRLEQGATPAWQFTIRHVVGSQPFDLSGCTLRAQIKESINDTLPLASMTTEIVDQYNGVVVLSLSKAESAKLTRTKCVWDAFMETADGYVLKLLYGEIVVVRRVTA